MSRKKDETEPENEETETENEPVTELTTREKIAKKLADMKATADLAVAAANKQAEEAEALASVEIDSDVEAIVDRIKEIDADVTEMKAKMVAEIEPLNVQIAEIKTRYNFEDMNKNRKDLSDALIAKVGETATKVLIGGAKATGAGKGKGRSSSGTSKKEIAVRAVCDEGLTLVEAVERYPELESVDGARKNLWKPLKDAEIVKNIDGIYSRA